MEAKAINLNDGSKQLHDIEWEELLQLLSQFQQQTLVRAIMIKPNNAAHSMDMVHKNHVALDIFVWYFGKAPSLKVQMGIAKGFIGDNGPCKFWDGLNVSALWKDPSARHYSCYLYWPPAKDTQISQADVFYKMNFIPNGGRAYKFEKPSPMVNL